MSDRHAADDKEAPLGCEVLLSCIPLLTVAWLPMVTDDVSESCQENWVDGVILLAP
jgi:hypothetical protein